MNKSRIEYILNSAEKFDVYYKGQPIWINSLNSNKNIVDITLNKTQERIHVNINELIEKN